MSCGAFLSVLAIVSATRLPPTAVAGDLPPLRISYSLQGYFFAGSRIPDRDSWNDGGPSDNLPTRVERDLPARASLLLIALPDERVPFNDEVGGFRVILANTSLGPVALGAAIGQLNIVREARDRDGRWKAIEWLPDIWCGNAFHRVHLPAGEQWTFVAPLYAGSQRTTMRFVLRPRSARDPVQPIYSNEFTGSVEPGQFSLRKGPTVQSHLDPYRERTRGRR